MQTDIGHVPRYLEDVWAYFEEIYAMRKEIAKRRSDSDDTDLAAALDDIETHCLHAANACSTLIKLLDDDRPRGEDHPRMTMQEFGIRPGRTAAC